MKNLFSVNQLYNLDSKISVFDDGPEKLPLDYFEYFILVEPDSGKWKVNPKYLDLEFDIRNSYIKRIEEEITKRSIDPSVQLIPNRSKDIPLAKILTRFVLLANTKSNMFSDNFSISLPDLSFIYSFTEKNEIPEDFSYFLEGLYSHCPNFNIAVFGGMFEDEVVRTANICARIGFKTTILTRYCISMFGYEDVDFLCHKINSLLKKDSKKPTQRTNE